VVEAEPQLAHRSESLIKQTAAATPLLDATPKRSCPSRSARSTTPSAPDDSPGSAVRTIGEDRPVNATIIHSLDQHSGSVSAVLTAALVLVTGYYAAMNRRAVQEMRAARNAALLPKLALEFHRLGPMVVDLAIRNVGPGAAIAIDVEIEWLPVIKDDASKIRWRRNLLSSGEQVELAPPGDRNGNLDTLPKVYRDIRLRGAMQDAGGKPYVVEEAFGNITEWRDLLGDAHEIWRPPEPERRMSEAFARQFDVDGVSRAVKEIAASLLRHG